MQKSPKSMDEREEEDEEEEEEEDSEEQQWRPASGRDGSIQDRFSLIRGLRRSDAKARHSQRQEETAERLLTCPCGAPSVDCEKEGAAATIAAHAAGGGAAAAFDDDSGDAMGELGYGDSSPVARGHVNDLWASWALTRSLSSSMSGSMSGPLKRSKSGVVQVSASSEEVAKEAAKPARQACPQCPCKSRCGRPTGMPSCEAGVCALLSKLEPGFVTWHRTVLLQLLGAAIVFLSDCHPNHSQYAILTDHVLKCTHITARGSSHLVDAGRDLLFCDVSMDWYFDRIFTMAHGNVTGASTRCASGGGERGGTGDENPDLSPIWSEQTIPVGPGDFGSSSMGESGEYTGRGLPHCP